MPWFLTPYARYFAFGGRSPRIEFWTWAAFTAVVGGLLGWVAIAIFAATSPFQSPLYWLFFVANLIPGVTVGIRRLHDTGRSGWWLLISLLPVVGAIWLIVLYVLPGERGPNRFGADPLLRRRSGSLAQPEVDRRVSVLDQLNELASLRDRSALSESEFARLKARVLDEPAEAVSQPLSSPIVPPPPLPEFSSASPSMAANEQAPEPLLAPPPRKPKKSGRAPASLAVGILVAVIALAGCAWWFWSARSPTGFSRPATVAETANAPAQHSTLGISSPSHREIAIRYSTPGKIPTGIAYSRARAELISTGLQPLKLPRSEDCGANDACHTVPEALNCAGNADVCIFAYKDRKGGYWTAHVSGSDHLVYDGIDRTDETSIGEIARRLAGISDNDVFSSANESQ